MSRRAVKIINWKAIAERIPETEKANFLAFKAKSDQYLQRMMAYPESQPKLDWTHYKKAILIPGLVEKLQKEYESFTVPYPADKYTSQIEAQEKEMFIQMEEFVKKSNENISGYAKEVERINGMLPFNEMTMEDFRDLYPEEAIDTYNKPTAWPHTPEVQPENEPPRSENHD